MKKEHEHISESLEELRGSLSKLPEAFAKAKRQADRKIDALCEEAGIMGSVEQVKNSLEAAKKQVQSQADLLSGRINALEELFELYHLAPIPEGMTHMYGLELESLDPKTRLVVMYGQESESWEETVDTLGGDPDRKDWDGSEDEEDIIVPAQTQLVPPDPTWEGPEEQEDYFDAEDPNLEAIRSIMESRE